MKFLQNGGFQTNPLMRLTLAGTLLFALGLWLTGGAMHFKRMSLRPDSVSAYYLGSAEEFSQPRSASSMLEGTHAHMATMGVMLLLLTHLMIFTPWTAAAKRWMICLGFGSSLLGEASGWLVRFVSPAFAPLKIACFLAFEGVLAILIASLSG